MSADWRHVLPAIASEADAETQTLLDSAAVMELPAGTTVFRQGDACRNYLIVLSGRLTVFTRAESGREIVLYRLSEGDSCVLTTSCLFGSRNYPAEGKTVTDVSALAIPVERFNIALQKSEVFRRQVFAAFSSHLSELITLVEEVAFGKIDIRLARLLLNDAERDVVRATHQDIATELGTAREVVSRQLKEMESRQQIGLSRGQITIIDRDSVQALADQTE